MKLFVAVLLAAAASAGRLENTYLPPSSARLAGGSGGFLAAPSVGFVGHVTPVANPSAFYGVPAAAARLGGAVSTPSAAYGFPAAAVKSYTGPVSPPVPILRLNNDNNGEGSYRYDYETANHITAQEAGHLKDADTIEVQGGFAYQAPNGQTISVSYVADENGFRATGDHLPTPPPIPAAILKSLELNAAEEARGVVDNGQYYQPAASRQFTGASVSNQYLPPLARQGGYRY